MVLEEFTQKFAECFHQTDASEIKPDTKFKNLDEWGSMLALIIIAMIDAEFGKTLSSEDLKAAETVSELFERLRKQ
ncbi:MAG: acyl carrier protein [Bacteroidetes bacterium]|nr:acyl carrier protein [Bacteroidota bacterium]MBK8658573.1 acyl carrier protein [Bacteroidota bacterium]